MVRNSLVAARASLVSVLRYFVCVVGMGASVSWPGVVEVGIGGVGFVWVGFPCSVLVLVPLHVVSPPILVVGCFAVLCPPVLCPPVL